MAVKKRFRMALLIHSVSPYRVRIFQSLNEEFELDIVLSGKEANRRWEQIQVPGVRSRLAWGLTFGRRVTTTSGGVAEEKYLHLNPGYLWELVRLRPHAIISTEMGLRSLIAVLYGRMWRVPVWVWWEGGFHSSRLYGSSLPKRLLRRQFFARLVEHWIAFGEVSTEYLRSLGVDKDSILQVQNPVDERQFDVGVKPYALDGPRPRALFVGRLIENKGIYPLLEATARLQASGLVFSLIIVGEGPELDRFDAMRQQLGIENFYRLAWIDPETMSEIYKAADFLVFPTFDDVWGLVVNEAMLMGLPVIASKYAGCSEELLPDTNIFDPMDQDDFERIYRRAVIGDIAPSDVSRVQSIYEISELISKNINNILSREKHSDGA